MGSGAVRRAVRERGGRRRRGARDCRGALDRARGKARGRGARGRLALLRSQPWSRLGRDFEDELVRSGSFCQIVNTSSALKTTTNQGCVRWLPCQCKESFEPGKGMRRSVCGNVSAHFAAFGEENFLEISRRNTVLPFL